MALACRWRSRPQHQKRTWPPSLWAFLEPISGHNSPMSILSDIFWQQEGPIEERIGNLIGKVFVLVLTAFFIWAYWPTVAAQLGLLR